MCKSGVVGGEQDGAKCIVSKDYSFLRFCGETSAEVKQKSGETRVIQKAFSPPGCPRFPIQVGRELREEVRHLFLSSLSPWASRLGCLGLRSSRGELADLKKGRGSWQC